MAMKKLKPGKLTARNRAELKQFQNAEGLQADGIYGRQSHGYMIALIRYLRDRIDKLTTELDDCMAGNDRPAGITPRAALLWALAAALTAAVATAAAIMV